MTDTERTAWVVAAAIAAVALILLAIAMIRGFQLRRANSALYARLELVEQYLGQLILAQLAPYPDHAQSIEQLQQQLGASWEVLSPVLSSMENAGIIRTFWQDQFGQEVQPHVVLTGQTRDALGQ